MSGLLPHRLAPRALTEREQRQGGIDPATVMNGLASDPIVDLLVRYLMQTEEQELGRRLGRDTAQPSPTPGFTNRMRDQAGPIQANKPKRIASERERIYRQIP